MKYLKFLGLAFVAILAVTALAGTASASAKAILCSTNTNPCTGTKYPSGTKVTAQLVSGTGATLTMGIYNIVCKKSMVSGVTTNAEAHGEITGLTFSECSLGTTPCSATAVNLPYTAEAVATAGGNGDLTITSKVGGGNPGATIVCGTTINCTFISSSITFGVTGGNPGILAAKEAELSRSGGLCPSTAKWDAEYEITAPKPLFLETS
jgi:hypothetical protein